ncbi:manganese/iron ABC transporter ATP-binding protein [Allofranklinella schreckenbergeri]|nr:manganese/iron ABC transporter ATP-binding protein [Allofranklinella schreckenbergeri]
MMERLPEADLRAAAAGTQVLGLSVQNVSVVYRNGHTALRQASFSTPLGSITALVGVNGSGKSTLFKAIMGLVQLDEGEVRVMDLSVREALRRRLIAYVPQSEEVDWNFPVLVEDVVMMGRYGHMGLLRRPRPADREAVAQALARVDMAELRKRQIGELSGGQKKRVFLARALAQEARVILLDEPFTGVDVKTEDGIIDLLCALRREGRVMLVSTHNLGSVPEFCDRTVLVRNTVLAYGPTAEVFTHDNLAQAFGGVLRHFDLPAEPMAQGAVVGIMSDDERPLVLLDGRSSVRGVPADPLRGAGAVAAPQTAGHGHKTPGNDV